MLAANMYIFVTQH